MVASVSAMSGIRGSPFLPVWTLESNAAGSTCARPPCGTRGNLWTMSQVRLRTIGYNVQPAQAVRSGGRSVQGLPFRLAPLSPPTRRQRSPRQNRRALERQLSNAFWCGSPLPISNELEASHRVKAARRAAIDVNGCCRSSPGEHRGRGGAGRGGGKWESDPGAGAINRDTMTDLFRRGEVLPEGATAEDERGASVPPENPNCTPHGQGLRFLSRS